MKPTPINWGFNAEMLGIIPRDAKRVIEVGCSAGGLARQYLALNPTCDYVGVEIDTEYANIAAAHCSRTVVGNVEQMSDDELDRLFPSDCWIFGDVLEHLYDPWKMLSRIRERIDVNGSVVACIPNAQHWSLQARLVAGDLWYEDKGLLDRTHIRFFTKKTIVHLFESSGFTIAEGGARIFKERGSDQGLHAVGAMAQSLGLDLKTSIDNAMPLQWIVRAVPKP